LISNIVERLPNTKLGIQISNQLIKSGTSPALNYGEAQSAESRNDFIHKVKIVLKELIESNIYLKIIRKKPLIFKSNFLNDAEDEVNQLISIFVKSIQTVKRNLK
jgi:four helix bundle protein